MVFVVVITIIFVSVVVVVVVVGGAIDGKEQRVEIVLGPDC